MDPCRKLSKIPGEDQRRFDEDNHLVRPVPEGGRRCAGSKCNSFGRTECMKCYVGLCIKCFVEYLTK